MTDRTCDNFLRFRAVAARVGMARTTIYRRIAAGSFPRSVQISANLVAWYESEIDAWMADPMGWRADG
jgi:prophage regulatory protein